MAFKTGVVFRSNFNKISKAIDDIALKRIEEASYFYRNELINEVKNSSKSGISYPVPSRSKTKLASGRAKPRKNPRRYTASAPGEIPAVATGRLVKSIRATTEKGKKIYGIIGSTVIYAKHLEFGTFKMKPRPFFWPVFKKNSKKIKEIISKKWW